MTVQPQLSPTRGERAEAAAPPAPGKRRRGVCPGLSAPMPTGDGLLARLLPIGPIHCNAFIDLCEAAGRHGNGTIEISARGSLQMRGLTPISAPLFASAVSALGIPASEGVSVIAGPLIPDADPMVDTAAVAAALRRAIAERRLVLSPKVSIVVDGGGSLHLDSLSADVRLRAAGSRRPSFHVGLGGDGQSATWLGAITPENVVDVIVGLLTAIAGRGPTGRAADILRAEGVEALRSSLPCGIGLSRSPPARAAAEVIGLHSAPDGTAAVGIGFAFGHAQAGILAKFVGIAAGLGTHAIRPAPGRALLLTGATAAHASRLADAAEQLGFVTRADDFRRWIAACPGAPACAAGLIPARALASELALALRSSGAGAGHHQASGIAVHISGCPKGCAHPMPAALTVVGTSNGCGIVRNGTDRAIPDHYVTPANLSVEISRSAARTHEAAHG